MNRLSKEDAEKALKSIFEKSGGLKCSVCGNTNFDVEPSEMQLMSYDRVKSNLMIEKPPCFAKVVVAHCTNCGYVLQFHLDTVLNNG